MKERIRKVVTIFFIFILLGLTYGVFVNLTGLAIPCLFYKVTGLKCPGCGITHMCVALLYFDFSTAFHSNQVLFVTLPFAGILFLWHILEYVKKGIWKLNKVENILCYLYIVVLVGFGILRNFFAL